MIIRKLKALKDMTIKTKVQTKMFFENDVDDITFSSLEEFRNLLKSNKDIVEAGLREPKATNIIVDKPVVEPSEKVVWDSREGSITNNEMADIPVDDETIEADMPEELDELDGEIDEAKEEVPEEIVEENTVTEVNNTEVVDLEPEEVESESVNLADRLDWNSDEDDVGKD